MRKQKKKDKKKKVASLGVKPKECFIDKIPNDVAMAMVLVLICFAAYVAFKLLLSVLAVSSIALDKLDAIPKEYLIFFSVGIVFFGLVGMALVKLLKKEEK